MLPNWKRAVILALVMFAGCETSSSPPEYDRSPGKVEPSPPVEQAVPTVSKPPSAAQSARQTVESIAAERASLDKSVYADEIAAAAHERTIVKLWDDLRRGDPVSVLRQLPFDELRLGSVTGERTEDWGAGPFQIRSFGEPVELLTHVDYEIRVDELAAAGWEIVQTEWHHSRFEPGDNGRPPNSVVSFEMHAKREGDRAIIRGDLKITWKTHKARLQPPQVASIDATDVEIIQNQGMSTFKTLVEFDPKILTPDRYALVRPLLVYDLNGDGMSEVILVGCNLLFWNRGEDNFEQADFLRQPLKRPNRAGILADFNGDGVPDFIGSSAFESKLKLYVGERGSPFNLPPQTCFDQLLEQPQVITAGDVDLDGDLDLFVGQYRAPYWDGTMATPYFDANDGPPNYLLENDGQGRFKDITQAAGLADRRHRRTYSASLVDLDDDRDLDLLVVSDFAGLDLYQNDGQGKFVDVSQQLVQERRAFGMSHTFDDFNRDGRLDFYMVGMSSTTARRLAGLGIQRPGFDRHNQARQPMSYGNRLYLASGDRFVSPPLADQVARTGWSWGCTSQDFDNDGDSDLYITNGHISGESAQDYCTRFWCHDIYARRSQPPSALRQFFHTTLGNRLGKEISWNGYEHNALFLNAPQPQGFLNAAFLLGVAYEFDARAVAADDLNRDGRVDLLVVEFDPGANQQRLHLARNMLADTGNWVGVDLLGTAGTSPLGAKVTLVQPDRRWTKHYVSGDSFTAQHAATIHFGLGSAAQVEAIEVRWPDGRTTTLNSPAVNRYHRVSPAAR